VSVEAKAMGERQVTAATAKTAAVGATEKRRFILYCESFGVLDNLRAGDSINKTECGSS
jgi:hypothetical protein